MRFDVVIIGGELSRNNGSSAVGRRAPPSSRDRCRSVGTRTSRLRATDGGDGQPPGDGALFESCFLK